RRAAADGTDGHRDGVALHRPQHPGRGGGALGAGQSHRARRRADEGGDGARGRDRELGAAVAAAHETDLSQGARPAAARGAAPRRRSRSLRVGGSQGGRPRLSGEARAGVEGRLSVDAAACRDGLYEALRPLFQPAHVAIIGASSTPGKQGNVALRYLRQGGYRGRVSPVNPAGGEIEGLTCYRSIAEVPGSIDCAFLVIPAAATVAAIRACADAGVRAAIIGANGFAELGTDAGRSRQAEVAAIARAGGMRLLGPNTNGIWNATDRLSLGYNTSHGDPMVD